MGDIQDKIPVIIKNEITANILKQDIVYGSFTYRLEKGDIVRSGDGAQANTATPIVTAEYDRDVNDFVLAVPEKIFAKNKDLELYFRVLIGGYSANTNGAVWATKKADVLDDTTDIRLLEDTSGSGPHTSNRYKAILPKGHYLTLEHNSGTGVIRLEHGFTIERAD